MHIDFETQTAEVISCLEQAGYHKETIADHQRCYDDLQMHIAITGRPSAMEVALEWLESRKSDWTYSTYSRYRRALFRLEKFVISGSIVCRHCNGLNDFACQSVVNEPYEVLQQEFRVFLSAKHGESIIERYTKDCTDFLVFLSELGLASPSDVSIEQILDYWQRVCNMLWPDGKKRRCFSAIVKLLAYLAERGDIPRCYSSVFLKNATAARLSSLRFDAVGTAFQPSKKLDPIVVGFLSSLDEQRYNAGTKKHYRHDFTNYFFFIEVNHLEYSSESVELWLKHTPENTLFERRRHTLSLFADYLAVGSTDKETCYTWQSLQIDSLPDWSRNIILGFVDERNREGLAQTTLKLCRLAGFRFFRFLDSKGVCNPRGITPELVKEFHNTDKHSTPLGKNTYGIKVRQLLSHMAEQKLVPQNLFLAISTQCAPCRNIVSVMDAEMESAVYQYRASATSPLELRNVAMVMLGLRMGVRASDIVNIKIENFDWQKRTVTFVQKKTFKTITLPVPVDVGNSVYKYITEGRPQSGAKGDGYVFIRHHAPFDGMKTIQACRYALKNIMSTYGLELPCGQGFHITRKTFATRLLTSKTSIDDISNALGHALHKTAETYLSRDEEGMRLCPLAFESVGAV